MAKQDEQKQKKKRVAHQDSSLASEPEQSTVGIKTATSTRPLPVLEDENVPESTEKAPEIPATIRRRQFLIGGVGVTASLLALGGWLWSTTPHPVSEPEHTVNNKDGDQLVVDWNKAALDTLRDLQTPLPVAARALSIVHTSMFDAWAAYDPVAVGTRLGASLRQPSSEQTLRNKCRAISYAAYRSLVDLFPGEQTRFQRLMRSLGYNPNERSTSGTPSGIGSLAAQAVLNFRHNDGSNQLGNLAPGAYADYTSYQSLNTPESFSHLNHWQPLNVLAEHGSVRAQQFVCPHWANVTPFALSSASQFIPQPGPPRYPGAQYSNQATQILQYSANLTSEQKALAEYWSATWNAQILARWFAFAYFISARDANTLDQNIKLFFSLANAGLDTSIACWACKRAYDSAYPVTVIHSLFREQQIRAWAGPSKGTQWFSGQYWLPYQPLAATPPAYPEYCSEQSAFSAAAAEILRNFTGKDDLGATDIRPVHSSLIELGEPAQQLTLSWDTLSQTASQAGMAGRYSGLHFTQSDLDGRLLGTRVARQVWPRAQSYINGHS